MKTVYITRNNLFKKIPMLLCNNITKVDPDFIEDNINIFQYPCEACTGDNYKDYETQQKCEECHGEGYHDSEPYQFFITSLDQWEKDRLTSYNVPFGYSNALEVDIIPIYDFGTSWSAFSYSKKVDDTYELANDETLVRETVY